MDEAKDVTKSVDDTSESLALTSRDGFDSVLIVGAGSGGQILAKEFQDVTRWKLNPIGFVDDSQKLHGTTFVNVPVLGDTNAIPAIVNSRDVDIIVLAIPSLPETDRLRISNIARGTGKKVLSMPPIGSILTGAVPITTLKAIQTRIKWYCGMALFSSLGAAKLEGVS